MNSQQINRLCERIIAFRDLFPPTQAEEKELLADVCGALDGYAKLTRAVDALHDEHDIVDVGAPGEHPGQGPNWAMQATTFIVERA